VNQEARDQIAGYNANTYGGAAGMDTQNISDRLVAGLALSYGHTNANSNNPNTTKTDIDSYQATLYGNYDLGQQAYIDGLAAYGWDQDNTTRHNVGGIAELTADGNFHASQIAAQAEAGRNYEVGETTLTPNVLAHWVNYNPSNYTETGAGGANLQVNGNTMNQVELGFGLKAGWTLEDGAGSLIKPQLHAGYRYAVMNDAIEDTSNFTGGGGTFITQGATPARSSVNLGGTIKLDTTNNWEFTASYDFDYRADYISNAGFIRAAYKF
jgi:outer membrane autotransporter protein